MAQRFDALLFRAGVVEQRRLLKFDFAKCRSLRLNGAISGTVWLSGRQFCWQAVPSQDEQLWRHLLNPGPAGAEWYGSSQAEDENGSRRGCVLPSASPVLGGWWWLGDCFENRN